MQFATMPKYAFPRENLILNRCHLVFVAKNLHSWMVPLLTTLEQTLEVGRKLLLVGRRSK